MIETISIFVFVLSRLNVNLTASRAMLLYRSIEM